MELQRPTAEEAYGWGLHTVRHSSSIEYFRANLTFVTCDPQHPHDLVGAHHKFTPPVFRGLSLKNPFDRNTQPEENNAFYRTHIEPSVMLHREGQYHHRQWHNPLPWATESDLLESAVDSVWAIVEGRHENGGPHTYEEAAREIQARAPYKMWAVQQVIPRMQSIPQPDIHAIKSLDDIPNIGIPARTHKKMLRAVDEVRVMVAENFGYHL